MANDPAGIGQSDPKVAAYLGSVLGPEDAILAEIRERASREGLPAIAVARLDGRHLTAIALAAGAKKIVEIGTLAGYSGVCLARALPHGGRLDTLEIDPKHASVARESFARAGVEKLAHIHVGKALESLATIEKHGPFDLVFIDADKMSYPDYLHWSAANLRRGGLVLADNVFRAALPPDSGWSPESIEALDLFNRDLAAGGDFVATFLPTVEGLAMGV